MLQKFVPPRYVGLYIFACTILDTSSVADRPLVRTSLGAISGYYGTSFKGRKFSAFEGIPYAKPPIGDLRFEESHPADPWIGIWNATYRHKCIQVYFYENYSNDPNGTEDCLYLNIFIPRAIPNPQENLDVLVYIHGGGFRFYSGLSYASPQYIMDRDVVFVTINYRLGMLGFLSTEDEVLPGNNGLKDQVLALKWVQNHIHNFGGNKNSVTIFGISAGAISVHMHYLSPMSKGLFHKGFSISGTAVNGGVLQGGDADKAKILAQAVGCPTTTSRILVDCLKTRPASELWKQTPWFLKYKYIPIISNGPVIETKSKNPFLSDHPYKLLSEGYLADVPWMESVTSAEDKSTLYVDEDFEYFADNWEYVAPHKLMYVNFIDKGQLNATSRKIWDYYVGNNSRMSDEYKKQIIRMDGERIFYCGVDTAARIQTRRNQNPVYVFMMDFNRHGLKFLRHAADGPYYFYKMDQREDPTDDELKMTNILLDMLVSYAKTGKPQIAGVQWEPTESDKLSYLRLSGVTSDKMIMKSVDKIPESKDFWLSLGLKENENLVKYKDEL